MFKRHTRLSPLTWLHLAWICFCEFDLPLRLRYEAFVFLRADLIATALRLRDDA